MTAKNISHIKSLRDDGSDLIIEHMFYLFKGEEKVSKNFLEFVLAICIFCEYCLSDKDSVYLW